MDITQKIDETIEVVCDKVKKDDCEPGEYADTVKALAELIQARAQLF